MMILISKPLYIVEFSSRLQLDIGKTLNFIT